MNRFDYYMTQINAGDFTAVEDAANDESLTNGEYCELYMAALNKAKEIGC